MTRKLGLSGCHSSELSADACQHAYDLCLWPFFSPIGANLRRFGRFQSAAPPNEGAPAWISEACRVPPKDWAIFKTLSMRSYIVVWGKHWVIIFFLSYSVHHHHHHVQDVHMTRLNIDHNHSSLVLSIYFLLNSSLVSVLTQQLLLLRFWSPLYHVHHQHHHYNDDGCYPDICHYHYQNQNRSYHLK